MVYTCLHAMRVGLLSRFWGSLGMALGAVSFIFFQFALLWFVYLAVLLARPRAGRPPAAGRPVKRSRGPRRGRKPRKALDGGGDDPPEGDNGAQTPSRPSAASASNPRLTRRARPSASETAQDEAAGRQLQSGQRQQPQLDPGHR